MGKMNTLAGLFVEDVNKEDSAIIGLFESVISFLFNIIIFAGVPFLLYVILQFASQV